MISEYKAFFEAFQKGKEVKYAIEVKNFQLLASAVAGLLTALFTISQGFGYHIPVSQETINQAASGLGSIYTIAMAICTVISTSKIGVK